MSHAFSLYLAVKWLHIVSSVFMVGTGFGSAFYMFFANRSGSVAAQAVVSRLLVRADWWFTTPAILIQPASGLWLAHAAGWPLGAPWIALTLALYALAGACWLPVVWLQKRIKLRQWARNWLIVTATRGPISPAIPNIKYITP